MVNRRYLPSRKLYLQFGNVSTSNRLERSSRLESFRKISFSMSSQIVLCVHLCLYALSIVQDLGLTSVSIYCTHIQLLTLSWQIAETPLHHYCDAENSSGPQAANTPKLFWVEKYGRLDFKFLFNGAWRRVSIPICHSRNEKTLNFSFKVG
jgi:hypothetical protein